MIYFDVEQNTDEWLALRLGKFSASMAGDLFMDKKTKGYKDAIRKIAYEIATGESEESYSNRWMQRGHEKEPFAADNYERYMFESLEKVGLYQYNDFVCASPDRKIIGKNAGVEFKCPSASVYDEYLETQKVPKDYYFQIHWQLLCTGWDYVDYMPYYSQNLKQICIRIERDEDVLNIIKEKAEECILEVKEKIKIISNNSILIA